MNLTYRNSLLAVLLAAVLVCPMRAVLLNNDYSGLDNLANFDGLPGTTWGTALTGSAVEVFNDGTLTVNLGGYNLNDFSSRPVYGMNQLIGSGTPTDGYLRIPHWDGGPNATFQQGIEFNVIGGAVSAIGIHISSVSVSLPSLTDIQLQIFDADGTVLESFTITSGSTPSLGSLATVNNDASAGLFVGFSTGANNITRFRLVGGDIVLDDLRFRTLDDEGPGGPGEGPGDPQAVPEASTFALCGSVLAGLAWLHRRRNR